MFEFHDDRHANMVLNFINRESRSVAQGLERRVLEFKWSFHQLPAHTLAPAVGRLCLEGLLFSIGNVLRLTPRGYGLMVSPEIRENSETFLTGQRESGPPTEYAIRNRVLSVFAHHGMKAGDRLEEAEIKRFWQVAHYRASELRDGLDILLRDGEIKISRMIKTYVRLEKDGDAYLQGRPTPEWLARLSAPMSGQAIKRQGMSDKSLRFLLCFQYREVGTTRALSAEELDYLLERHELPAFARFHAMDLAWRRGDIDARSGTGLWITPQGYELFTEMQSDVSMSVIQMELERMKKS